jgi:hypothetical protein
MKLQPHDFSCLKCKHEWRGEMLVDAPVEAWAALLKTTRCPKCGAGPKGIALGRVNVPEPAPSQDRMTDIDRRARWLAMHDAGTSSETIAEKMCGIPHRYAGHPHDGDDFGRCHRLLCLYPEWRARLGEMASVDAYWAALVPRWSEIEAAYRADLAKEIGKRAACYDLMRSILDPIEKADSRVVRFGGELAGMTLEFGR